MSKDRKVRAVNSDEYILFLATYRFGQHFSLEA